MGGLTEMLDFVTREELPSPLARKHIYTHIDESAELKKARRKFRAEVRKARKENNNECLY